jgi:hypothetical protein
MLPAVFEPAIPSSERLETLTLFRAATGIGPGEDLTEGIISTDPSKQLDLKHVHSAS